MIEDQMTIVLMRSSLVMDLRFAARLRSGLVLLVLLVSYTWAQRPRRDCGTTFRQHFEVQARRVFAAPGPCPRRQGMTIWCQPCIHLDETMTDHKQQSNVMIFFSDWVLWHQQSANPRFNHIYCDYNHIVFLATYKPITGLSCSCHIVLSLFTWLEPVFTASTSNQMVD